ncbi:hypothetical protein [Microbulbifer epialgicus]|uniref:Uncharacterized protein n=1 Tax=Microbulbifer epialgicus TaxID=393907 RepID=A0ABV4NV56_9GAMM
METEEIIGRLSQAVRPDYQWPEIPAGWQLEFILYPDGELDMDLLHLVSARFWSEDNGFLDMPVMKSGKVITVTDLKAAGVPLMTTFGHTVVSDVPKKPHLATVEEK